MDEKNGLTLNRRPDGYGFIYGQYWRGAECLRVDIMPPIGHWAGDDKLDGYMPHASDWVVYANGEEIARVAALGDLESALQALPSPDGGREGME